MRKKIELLILKRLISFDKINCQYETLYFDVVPYINSFVSMLIVEGRKFPENTAQQLQYLLNKIKLLCKKFLKFLTWNYASVIAVILWHVGVNVIEVVYQLRM